MALEPRREGMVLGWRQRLDCILLDAEVAAQQEDGAAIVAEADHRILRVRCGGSH